MEAHSLEPSVQAKQKEQIAVPAADLWLKSSLKGTQRAVMHAV